MKAILRSPLLWILLDFILLSVASTGTASPQTPSNSSSPKDIHAAVGTTTPPRIDYDALVTTLLNDASKHMQLIWNRKREAFLNMTSKGKAYNLVNQTAIRQDIDDYHRLFYELADQLCVIPVAQLRSANLRRQVMRLSKLQLYGLKPADYEEARKMLNTLQSFLTARLVCPHQRPADCSEALPMLPHIETSVRRTRRYNELEYYWHKWRDALAKDNLAKSTFINYVRLLRTAATYNGHVTPSRTWYLYYDSDNLQRELEDVIWQLMPLYRELHAYVRHEAWRHYGSHVVTLDGALPHPVLEQLLHSAWSTPTIFRTPYPRSHLPTVQGALMEKFATSLEINKRAIGFFESLGLNHMSDTFYDKFARRMSDEEIRKTGDCKTEVSYFPPDVALRFCPEVDYRALMQRHGDMAELQYNLYKRELPLGLDREPCPGFGRALGEAAVFASGTPRHLHHLELLDNYTLTAEQTMNRLFRMGLHTILAIPQYFVSDKFLVDVMDGRIGSNGYNCAYWRLQYKYAGVVPPTKRSEKHFDPDYKFYRGLNPEKPNTVKFISEVLGLQFYRALCLASGQYRAGHPEYPLNNCDFSGNKEAGKLIRDVMQLGATKHWRDILEMTTGERKLSARGVLEYFAPLYTWLKKRNSDVGLKRGWDSDIRCTSD